MRKAFCKLVFVFLVALLTMNCGSGGGSGSSSSSITAPVQIQYIGSSKMGYFEVTLNYNGKSEYQMGQLYSQVFNAQYPTYEKLFADYFLTLPAAYDYDEMMSRVQKIKAQIPQEYRDFIEGMASQFHGGSTNDKNDGVLSVDEVYFFSLVGAVQRVNQCSMIAVYGSSSSTGKPIIGRLFDWSASSHGCIVYINKGSKKIMNIGGSLLDQSITTGLNQYGIFAAVLDSSIGITQPYPDLNSDTYYAYAMDLRYALENYSSLDDVANYLKTRKYTFNHLIVLGDSNTVKVLENDLTHSRHLRNSDSELNTGITWGFTNAVAAVNAFLLKDNYDNFSSNAYNTYRWQSITNQMNSYLSSDNKITPDEMKKIATFYGTDINLISDGVIMNPSTQQIVVYDSSNASLQMFFRNNRGIGTVNSSDYFDVNSPNFWSVPVRF